MAQFAVLRSQLLRDASRAAILVVLIVCVLLAAEWFGTEGTTISRLQAISSTALPMTPLALGAGIVIATGLIDLSVAGLSSLLGMVMLALAAEGYRPLPAYLFTLVTASAFGLSQGLVITRLPVSALVLTLGSSFAATGVAYMIRYKLFASAVTWRDCRLLTDCPNPGTQPITGTLPGEFLSPIFSNSWIWVLVLVIGLTMQRGLSLGGLHHLATGLDVSAARRVGIDISRHRLMAFVASALLCYLFTMLRIVGFSLGGWGPASSSGVELEAIATAVIGGSAINGGWISPACIFLAVFLWEALKQLTSTWLPLFGTHSQEIGVGLLLIVVAISGADYVRRQSPRRGHSDV